MQPVVHEDSPLPSRAWPRTSQTSGSAHTVLPLEPAGSASTDGLERETGFEPATACLEGRSSTTELLPLDFSAYEACAQASTVSGAPVRRTHTVSSKDFLARSTM